MILLGFGLLSASFAGASVLYKCGTRDGSIAYTSKRQGFIDCKVISTFVDTPTSSPLPTPSVAKSVPISAKAPSVSGWVYQENVKARADFSSVDASVVSTAPKALFVAVASGGTSTAPVLVPIPVVPPIVSAVSTAALALASPSPSAVAIPAKAEAPMPRILRGAVYKVERTGGITEYTNVKPAGNAFAVLFTYIATCIACDVHSKIDFARTALNLAAYKVEIAAAAADFGVDSALLRAVIHAESAFNPMALSNKGAQGLMQLMPGTAGDLGVANAFDAAQNIRGGARYLSQLLKNFNNDSRLATAAYNAGPGAVQKYHGIPPYDETQLYVQRVATLRDRYQKAL
ncbi:MAG: lytic transglycosylase domain-containing protein [Dokdonella sp.]